MRVQFIASPSAPTIGGWPAAVKMQASCYDLERSSPVLARSANPSVCLVIIVPFLRWLSVLIVIGWPRRTRRYCTTVDMRAGQPPTTSIACSVISPDPCPRRQSRQSLAGQRRRRRGARLWDLRSIDRVSGQITQSIKLRSDWRCAGRRFQP
jgi:hypothetical protein